MVFLKIKTEKIIVRSYFLKITPVTEENMTKIYITPEMTRFKHIVIPEDNTSLSNSLVALFPWTVMNSPL